MDKILNTDCTENTDLTFSQIFLVGKWLLDFYQDFVDSRVPVALPFIWKASDNILLNTSLYHTPKRKCPSTCRSCWIQNKIQMSLTKYYQKNESVKRLIRVPLCNPCFIFFDLCPRRRLGTQRQHGTNISVRARMMHLSNWLWRLIFFEKSVIVSFSAYPEHIKYNKPTG